MSTEIPNTPKLIPEILKATLSNPQLRTAILDSVVHKKPAGWGRRSRAVYYSEFFAKQIKKTIDEMIASKEDCIFEYTTFSDMAPSTLYQRINQSMRYLIECMDDDNRTYGKFSEMVKIQVVKGKLGGIKLMWKEEHRETPLVDFSPRKIIPEADKPKWREAMDKFIESDDTGQRPFIRDGLCLTPEEIRQLKTEFVGTEATLLVDIKSHCIKIIKIV